MKLKGKVKKGVQLASGLANNCKYHNGTIFLQRLTMKYHDDRFIKFAKKLDKMNIFNGTINVKLNKPIVFKNPDYYVDNLNWFPSYNESFSFIKCKIKHKKKYYDGFIYRPQPSDLSEHDKYTIEVLSEKIKDVSYGDDIEVFIRNIKVKNLSLKDKIKLFFVKNPKEIKDL